MHRGLPWAGDGLVRLAQALGIPLVRGSPPHTPRSPRRTPVRRRHEFYQLGIYMHEMTMQCLVIYQQQLLN